jgi:hypothetical protein
VAAARYQAGFSVVVQDDVIGSVLTEYVNLIRSRLLVVVVSHRGPGSSSSPDIRSGITCCRPVALRMRAKRFNVRVWRRRRPSRHRIVSRDVVARVGPYEIGREFDDGVERAAFDDNDLRWRERDKYFPVACAHHRSRWELDGVDQRSDPRQHNGGAVAEGWHCLEQGHVGVACHTRSLPSVAPGS